MPAAEPINGKPWPGGATSPELARRVADAHVLAVGAGGIGCELLKTLVMTGFKHIEVVRPLCRAGLRGNAADQMSGVTGCTTQCLRCLCCRRRRCRSRCSVLLLQNGLCRPCRSTWTPLRQAT